MFGNSEISVILVGKYVVFTTGNKAISMLLSPPLVTVASIMQELGMYLLYRMLQKSKNIGYAPLDVSENQSFTVISVLFRNAE